MNPRTLSLVFVVIAFVTLLEPTEAAVVGHHSDPIRKSIQSKTGLIQTPSFLLFRRTTEAQDDETDGSSLIQEPQYRPEPQGEDKEPLSFMMISTSTFNTNDESSGSDPFGGYADSPDAFSVDMTIIQISDSPALETRKVARRFGSRGPLSIERSYTSYAAALPSDSNNESASSQAKSLTQNTPAAQDAQLGSGMLQDLWRTIGARNNQIPWSVPTGGSRTEKAESPQDSYQKLPPALKTEVPRPFTNPVNEQIVLNSSPTFDNTSHHSQL